MKLFLHFSHLAIPLVGALLWCMHPIAQADEIADANKLFRQGNHTMALEKVNGILYAKPEDAQARFLKGLILTEQNNIPEAIQIFSGLTRDYPELPEPHNNLAVLYASQGNYDKAKLALESAIRTHPSYSTAHENLGDIYAKMASQAYDRALQLDRSNSATQTKLAMIQDLFAAQPLKKEPPVKETPTKPVVIAAASSASSQTSQRPAPTPAAAAAPKQTPAASKPKNAQSESLATIISTVNAWAAAWSAQNVSEYLSFYAADFKPAGGESRSSWEATRRIRVSAPESIKVVVGKPTIRFTDATHATVRFRQSYRASHHRSNANKTLQMVKNADKWQIQEELSK